jgi:hypothetical protein
VIQPLAYTIDQLKELGGPGRDKAYEEIRNGNLRARKFGRATRVLAIDFEAYMTSLPAIEPSGTEPHIAPATARKRRFIRKAGVSAD